MRIVFENGMFFDCVDDGKNPISVYNTDRQGVRIAINGEYAGIKAAFVNDAIYHKEWDSEEQREDGTMETIIKEQDLSEYCKVTEITDKCDGVFWVCMGKKTELEKIKEDNEALSDALLTEMGGMF